MHYDDLLDMLNEITVSESDTEVDILEDAFSSRNDAKIVPRQYEDVTYDLLIKNARVVTMDPDNRIIERASVAIKNGIILLITTDNIPVKAGQTIDADEKIITPGLIDCHTHLIYAGNCASPVDVAKATRHTSLEELTWQARQRALVMLAHGTTTVEIKSGYGLDLNTEIKILTVARMLDKNMAMTIVPTFLGAYATPPEYKHDPDGYMDYIISTMLPVIVSKKLAVFVDVFCESIVFNTAQVERLCQAVELHGLKLKLHAEQLTDQNSTLLATRYGACSVTHPEYLSPEDCKNMANDKTVAVLQPGAFYFSKESRQPPIAALRSNHIPMAIATGVNPGASPFLTLPLMMNMAWVLFGLSIEEAWRGVTINAARALNLGDELGSIEIGKKADLIIWSTANMDDIVYNPSINFCKTIVKSGQIIKGRAA